MKKIVDVPVGQLKITSVFSVALLLLLMVL